jgi:hypothetical protein
LPETGQRAGKILDGADHDLVLADAHLLRGDRRTASASAACDGRRAATASLMLSSWFLPRYGYCPNHRDQSRYMASISLGIFLTRLAYA